MTKHTPTPTTTTQTQTTPKVTRAALRYFGGKWQIAPWVIAHLPAHRIYVEPFGGAASVLLRKPPSAIEVYNDLDEEIVGIFRILQDPAQCSHLIRRLRRTPYARASFEQAFQPTCCPITRAQRAIVRASMAFHHGALFDLNKRTFADARHRSANRSKAHEWTSYPRHLVRICQRLQNVIIERRDALDIIRAQDTPDTLFFVDPPYLPSTRSSTSYRCELTQDQHIQLLTRLQAIQGHAVIAGYPSALYDDLLQGWHRIQRPHRAAGSQRPRTEVLWISPSAPAPAAQ